MKPRALWLAAALLAVACGDIGPGDAGKAAAPAPTGPAPASATGPSPIVTAIRTASDARYHIESRGFSNVANFGQDAEGRWTATAVLNGAPVNVVIAADGSVQVVEPAAKK